MLSVNYTRVKKADSSNKKVRMKSIKEKYEERDDKTTFEIEWEHDGEETPINSNKFKTEIAEFVECFQPYRETFEPFPFDLVKGFQPDKEMPLIEFPPFRFGLVKGFQANEEVSSIKLYHNKLSGKYISNIFRSLSFIETILKIHVYEDNQDKVILSAIKNYLKTNKTIRILRYGQYLFSKLLSKQGFLELREIVDSHPSIICLQVYERFILPKGKSEMLKKLVHSALQSQYEEIGSLQELPVILMGDGRTGKTSLLRNLSGKSFQKETQSTLVLEDHQILQVNERKFRPLTKYDLSVQRVKNMLSIGYSFEDEVQKESTYDLEFEDELITRTLREKSFVEQYTTNYDSGFRTRDTFLRVYDFGGQEVFSSVHHIFMNKKAIYLIVFNMTKLNEKDLFRLKFWCDSILGNTPKAPVLFIGTYLNTFLKKNKSLENMNNKIKYFLSKLSGKLTIVEDIRTIFFPVENAIDSNMSREKAIKVKLMSIGKYKSKLYDLLNPFIWIKSVYVLFLDNCREESSYMTVEKFKLKAEKCNFSEEEMEEMLEIYSKEGIISYFKDINLSESENFIFFALSFFAQALGSFIRDESFHQLAFRTNKKVFSNYRKYIDTGIIRKDLFEVLLQQYTKKEREYVLNLALHSLILFADPRERNSFIVPELLPEVKDSKLKISLTPDLVWKTDNPITRQKFLQIVFIFFSHKKFQDSFLYKFFSRIIFGPDEILDIFLIKEKELGFRFIGTERDGFLVSFIQQLIEESNVNKQVEEIFHPEKPKKPRFQRVRRIFYQMRNIWTDFKG
eukprot:maker-scaffold_67-snap-gene-0.4-mRNA-1 protein AED:0.63 eAED:0.63 QI:9/0.33/0.42/0.57/0.5/0.57/7/0/791